MAFIVVVEYFFLLKKYAIISLKPILKTKGVSDV